MATLLVLSFSFLFLSIKNLSGVRLKQQKQSRKKERKKERKKKTHFFLLTHKEVFITTPCFCKQNPFKSGPFPLIRVDSQENHQLEMESQYGIGINNRYALFLDEEGEENEEVLLTKKKANEAANKNVKVAPVTVNNVKDAAANKASNLKKNNVVNEKNERNREGKLSDN